MLNKSFSKKKTPKEETFILYDTSDGDFSSSSEAYNSCDEDGKYSINYNSESSDYNEIINSSICSERKVDSTVAEMELSSIKFKKNSE